MDILYNITAGYSPVPTGDEEILVAHIYTFEECDRVAGSDVFGSHGGGGGGGGGPGDSSADGESFGPVSEWAQRRNDREEIRRKLAMGVDDDQFMERPHRKPSLHSRLQSGMNLQICFMNETASDCESQCSDTESTQDRDVETDRVSTTSVNSKSSTPQPTRTRAAQSETDRDAPVDFFARQAQLQAEARMALAQAKEMARMQMEIEKQSKNKSPISEIVRESFNKIGVPFPDSKRRISRQILTDMNVAQLQVIVNDLHTQIESLNEELVTYLMERDDLHMEQDSMLVDIEDLTKHIGAKELSLREPIEGQDTPKITPLSTPPSRSKSNSRLKSIVKK